jgi:hypothetical protein
MMFSSLFQHFGKRERERERLVHFQMTMSPQFMSLAHYLCREGGGKKKYLQQSKRSTMSIIG